MDYLQLRQFSQEYISYCRYEKGLDVKTLKAYSIDLQQFMGSFPKKACFAPKKHCTHILVIQLPFV